MKNSTNLALSLLLAAACGGEIDDAAKIEPAPSKSAEALTVDAVTRSPADAAPAPKGLFTLRLRITNHSGAALYAYASPLREALDDGGRTLTLTMHEAPTTPPAGLLDCHLMSPPIAKVPAQTSVDIDVHLPSVAKQLVANPAGGAPVVVSHAFAAASNVRVELGYSDRVLGFSRAQGESDMCQYEGDLWLKSIERGVAIRTLVF